jgi:hypothetical protein
MLLEQAVSFHFNSSYGFTKISRSPHCSAWDSCRGMPVLQVRSLFTEHDLMSPDRNQPLGAKEPAAATDKLPCAQAPAASSAHCSLCMIVRNEERYLAGCLESVADLVDEIVVVDTGSTDNTPDIARRFGARVFHFQWVVCCGLRLAGFAYSAGGTQTDLENAYKLYLKCADAFWTQLDVTQMSQLPASNWEHFFTFTQTHSCSGRPCVSPSFSCFGSLGSIGTYGTLGGCFGTAGTVGTFATRGG